MGKIPSRGSDQFVLRFPDGMRDRLRHDAEKNGRSMNAEIISRLEASESGDPRVVEELRERLAEESAAFLRMSDLYQKMTDVTMDYREVLQTVKAQLKLQMRNVEILASFILSLEGPPPREMIDIVEKMKLSARAIADQMQDSENAESGDNRGDRQ